MFISCKLYSKVMFTFVLSQMVFNFSYAKLQYYPVTDSQSAVYESAILFSEANLRPVVFVIGKENCPWCESLANLMMFSELGRDIALYATIQPINLMGDVQNVIDSLKSKAGMLERIPGYPFIFVFDPVRRVTTAISLAAMELNIPEQNVYTHHLDLVRNAVFTALGLYFQDTALKTYSGVNEGSTCLEFLNSNAI